MIAYSIDPDLAGFNERGNWCDINVPIDTALYVYGSVPIIGALCLSFQMRRVRKQMNFFRLQVSQLLFLLMTGTVVFPLLEGWLESRDDLRRTWIMYDNVVVSEHQPVLTCQTHHPVVLYVPHTLRQWPKYLDRENLCMYLTPQDNGPNILMVKNCGYFTVLPFAQFASRTTRNKMYGL